MTRRPVSGGPYRRVAILSPAPTETLCPIQGYGQINGLVDDELPGHRDDTPTTRWGCCPSPDDSPLSAVATLAWLAPAAHASAVSIRAGSSICQTTPLLTKYALAKTRAPSAAETTAPTRPVVCPERHRATAATLEEPMNSGLTVRHTSPQWSPNRSLYPLASATRANMPSARLRTQGTRRVLNQTHQTPSRPAPLPRTANIPFAWLPHPALSQIYWNQGLTVPFPSSLD